MRVTTAQAAKILHCNRSQVPQLLKNTDRTVIGAENTKAIYGTYDMETIEKIAQLRNGEAERQRARGSYCARNYVKKKRIPAKNDDPRNVMIKQKEGVRMCPLCEINGPLKIGQHICDVCRKVIQFAILLTL